MPSDPLTELLELTPEEAVEVSDLFARCTDAPAVWAVAIGTIRRDCQDARAETGGIEALYGLRLIAATATMAVELMIEMVQRTEAE